MGRILVALTILPWLASAQAIVERAVLTSATGTSATASKSAGKGAAAVFDSLNKTLGQATKSEAQAAANAPAAPGKKAATAKPAAAPRPVEPIDPLLIKAGMAKTELIRRFGEPSLKSTVAEAGVSCETFWYSRAGKEDVVIRLKDGAVSSVSPPPAEAKNSQ